MSTSADTPEPLCFYPQPRQVSLLGGAAELSRDVRLVTNNVLPLQRKAMRGILTAAGVRVVANKKKFIIEAQVLDPGDLDMSDVPEEARDEYYEIEVQDNRVFVRTASQAGALWGTHTLGAVYRAAAQDTPIPNMLIRDWPELRTRGIFVESKWGPDRMALVDWQTTIDRVAEMKMNCLGVGIYGCWGSCRYEGQPTEFLMVPVPEYEELKTEKHLRWFSPDDDEWCDERYLPDMFEFDFLGDVVAYGVEKGVTVVPFVNSLGHNTMIPRVLPEVSAKNEDGSPRGIGYCLSSPKTREFLETFYGGIIERYFEGKAELFHVQLDEVWPDYPDPADPSKRVDPWCQCPECKAKDPEENLQDYIVWLVKMLVDKGVERVVMWNDQLTRHMDALDEGFVQRLKDAGVADRLILHWWWYSNDQLNDKTRVALGKAHGLPGWVAPMTCYFNWERYDLRRKNIEMMLSMAHAEGADGAVSYAVHDPGWSDHEALLGAYAWNPEVTGTEAEEMERWAAARFGGHAKPFTEALLAIQEASTIPAIAHTYNYRYTYCHTDAGFPRAYPGEALEKLESSAEVGAQLARVIELAEGAAAAFRGMSAEETFGATEKATVKSLLGEAARLEALASTFLFFLDARKALAKGTVDEGLTSRYGALREDLLADMAVIEKNKPDWVVPATLQALSRVLAFLDQLNDDLKEVASGKQPAGDVRWTLAN